MTRSKVDLPAPFGPTMAVQPAVTSRQTSRSASIAPSLTLTASTCTRVIAAGRDEAAR